MCVSGLRDDLFEFSIQVLLEKCIVPVSYPVSYRFHTSPFTWRLIRLAECASAQRCSFFAMDLPVFQMILAFKGLTFDLIVQAELAT